MRRFISLSLIAFAGACAPRADVSAPPGRAAGSFEANEGPAGDKTENEKSPAVSQARHANGAGTYEELDVPGFLPAVLFLPTSSGARPLVVAAHGAGGVPEYECEYWRRLSRGRATLLCLRGARTSLAGPSGFYYPTHHVLGQEFRAALAALKNRSKVSFTSGLYAGFSQGAIMGAPMIVPHAREFSRLVLIEGGYEYWSPATARAFGANGGKRVLFVCGTKWCKDKAEIPVKWLAEAKVEARIEYAEGAGHTPGGAVMTRTANALPWVVEGDPSWSD